MIAYLKMAGIRFCARIPAQKTLERCYTQRTETCMPIARPIRETEADREFDDALRRIRTVYRKGDGSTDWDRFYGDVQRRQDAANREKSADAQTEGQDVRTGTDPA
ncbi:MAG: hypothetical protein ACRD27_08900 [Terracidiphilus sp.]